MQQNCKRQKNKNELGRVETASLSYPNQSAFGGMFGTPLIRDDENANYRYHWVRQYQAARERFEATTPMRADASSLCHPEDLRDVVERLSRVVPVWDFTAPDWLARNPDFWDDPSHFKPTVGLMMLERMFGNPAAAPAGFGVLQGAGSAARPVSQTPL